MIHEVRSKVSKAPGDNFTVAVCDGCGSQSPASRLVGRKGLSASTESVELAKAAGWVERTVADTNPRRRRMTWTVELHCPACAAKGGANPQE